MGGNSKLGGITPRRAGFIALWTDRRNPHYEPLYVCLVTKQSGVGTFPGGSRDEDSEETFREAAARHWTHKVPVAASRLETIPNVHVDDRKYGCRYFVADCGESEAGTQQPDSRRWSWPPSSVQLDQNSVTNARWVSVASVLQKSTLLSPVRVGLLEEALEHRKGRAKPDPWSGRRKGSQDARKGARGANGSAVARPTGGSREEGKVSSIEVTTELDSSGS